MHKIIKIAAEVQLQPETSKSLVSSISMLDQFCLTLFLRGPPLTTMKLHNLDGPILGIPYGSAVVFVVCMNTRKK